MRGYSADSRVSRVVVGEVDTVWFPRYARVDTYGVILLHGQSNPQAFISSNQEASVRLAGAIASQGIPCVAAEMHGDSWANDSSMTDIDNARTLLSSLFPSMKTDKICLIGGSMGAALGTRYSQLNPDEVAAFVGIIPAYDPKTIYVNNDVGDAAMEAAWSFVGLGNFPDALDLGPKGADADTVPILTGYASNDTVVPSASVIAYHTLAGGEPENLINLGAVGHTNAAIAAMSIQTIIQFLIANGA